MNTDVQDNAFSPYPGPRPFRRRDKDIFFGRDPESADMMALITGRRLSLFYAASGAGKSSLIQAKLIPLLEDRGFEVLPVGRVSGPAPRNNDAIENIFIYHLKQRLAPLQPDAPAAHRAAYLGATLSEFLLMLALIGQDAEGNARFDFVSGATNAGDSYVLPEGGGGELKPRLLFLDQFEELFTTHLQAWEQREPFFRQLRQAMDDDPLLYVVLVMREDYIAYAEDYIHLLPELHTARYGMKPMGEKAASDAIQLPVAERRPYAAGVAAELVKNFRLVQTKMPDGRIVMEEGPYVEPVQLQVVCKQLWETIRGEAKAQIDREDLERVSKGKDLSTFVVEALKGFYNDKIAEVLAEAGGKVDEAGLRRWFGDELITEMGTRDILSQGSGQTRGLSNEVVSVIERTGLIRSEIGASGARYELTHDRFIEPIRQANEEWHRRQVQQDPLLAKAEAWEQSHADPARRDPALLLSGSALADARAYAEARRGQVSEELQAFIEASRNAEDKRNARNARRFRNLSWALGVAAAIAFIAMLFALDFGREASKEREIAQKKANEAKAQEIGAGWQASRANREAVNARVARLEADSLRLAGEADHAIDPDTALALALAANRITAPGPPPEAALTSLVRAVFNTRARQKLFLGAAIYAVDHHPATGRALLGGTDGSLTLWDLKTGAKTRDLPGHAGTVWAVAISEDGNYALSGDSAGGLLYWDLTNRKLLRRLPGHKAADGAGAGVWRALFVPAPPSETPTQQGQAAAPPRQALSAGSDGLLRLWDLQTGEELRQFRGHRDWVYSLAVSPDGKWALSGSEDGQVLLWDLTSPGPEPAAALEHPGWVRAVAFSPDGTQALSAAGQIKLWQLDPADSTKAEEKAVFGQDSGTVNYDLGFATGDLFYSVGAEVQLWDVQKGTATVLSGHTDAVRGLSFRRGQGRASLLTAGLDGVAILWDLETGALQQAYPLAAAAAAGPSSAPTPQTCTGRETYGPIAVGVEVILGQHDVMNGDANWNEAMAAYVGRRAKVTSLGVTDGQNCLMVRVDIDGGQWMWRIRNLRMAGTVASLFAAEAYSVTHSSEQSPYLLAASQDYLDLWDKNVGQLLARQPISLTLAGQAPACLYLASPRSAVVRGGQGRIVRIDLVTGKSDAAVDATCQPTPATPAAPAWTHPLAAAIFSSDGQWAAATDRRGGWQAWPVGDPDAAPVEAEREGLPLSSVAPGPGGAGLLAGSFAGEVLLWQTPQDAPVVLWPTSGVMETGGPVYDLAVNRDRTRAISAHADGSLRLWDLEERRLLAQDKAPQTQSVATPTPEFQTTPPATPEAARSSAAIVSVAMDADGTLALSGGLDGSLHLWEINADGLRWLAALPAVDSGPVWDVALSQDGSRGLSAHQNGALVVWDIPDRKELPRLVKQPLRLVKEGPPINAVRFDPSYIVSGDDQGKITIWNPRSGRNIFSIDQAGGAVAALALSSDGTDLLTSEGATLYRWQLLPSPPAELQEDLERFVLQLPCSDWRERYALAKELLPTCLSGETSLPAASGPTPTPAPVRMLEPKPAVMGANPGFIAPRTRERWLYEANRPQFLIFTAQAARPASGISEQAQRIERGKLDTNLRLFDADGNERASNDDIVKGANTDAQLLLRLERGRHELEVSGWDDLTSGAYTLTVATVDSILPGETVTPTLAAGERGYRRFVGEAGSMVDITLRSDAFDTYLELRDGDGKILVENDDFEGNRNARIANFMLPGSGDYLVVARGFSSEGAGEYQLTLQKRSVRNLPTTRFTPAYSAESTWSFRAQAGEFVRITSEGRETPAISLRAPSGEEVAGLNLSTAAEGAHFLARLPQAGTYLVVVTAGSADYRLRRDRLTPRPLPPDGVDQAASFAATPLWACSPEVCGGFRTFTVQAGQPGIRPAMQVWGPDGALLARAAPSGDDSAAIPLLMMSQTGDSHILVASDVPTATYSLTMGAPARRPIDPNSAVPIEEETTAGILWTFRGEAGQRVRIEMRKASGSELDSFLELYGPDGQMVAQDDDSLGDRNSLIEYDVEEGGEYTILPRGYDGQQGRYTLLVQWLP